MEFLKKPLAILRRMGAAIGNIDRVLLVSLFLTMAFTVEGINWGRDECWNADEVALRSLFRKNKPPFEPSTFTKPPFHTYLTYFLVERWVPILEGYAKKRQRYLEHPKVYTVPKNAFNDFVLLGARFLTLALYLGSVTLAYVIAHRFFGLLAARVTALLMATSAGFIAFNHFLTADSPMIFWMLLAFFFSQRIITAGTWPDYLLAGFFAGLGTATKYNALAVGMAIPVAHWLRSSGIWQALFSPRLILGVLTVPLAFVLGCPYAVLDHRNFIKDFMYNYTVTPNYGGTVGAAPGYLDFLGRLPEILGWPGAVWVALAVTAAVATLLIAGRRLGLGLKGFLLAASVVVLYYIKIGSFSRIETRFVLPIVPLFLLMAGPFLEVCARKPAFVYVSLLPVLAYNCICSFYVGIRFGDDPRMAAQTWVRTHLANGVSIESTQCCSNWNRIPGLHLDERRTPNSNERGALFARVFSGNPWVLKSLDEREGQVNPADFTLAALQARNPEYLAMDSLAYGPLTPGPVKSYFTDLLAGRYPYRTVFDLQNPPAPSWVYPRQIDFLENRITILQRIGGQNTPAPPESDTDDSD
jgi:hypothetical protein